MSEKAEGRRRARIAVKGELGRRGWNIQQLHEASGLDRNTLGDFLDGKRWGQAKTLGAIERALGWPPGSIAGMEAGDEAPNVSAPDEDPLPTEDALLYRRPDGLSDEEWERVKEESRGFIEWQIAKAAQER